jgi:hypothetical protein
MLYEWASEVRLKHMKSKALAIGGWNTPAAQLDIGFPSHVKILGVTFGSNIDESTKENWANTTTAVRSQERKAYSRELCLAQGVHVKTCLLAKIGYVAHILPPLKAHTQQLTTICTWYIWQGATFRVPDTTLRRHQMQGGWELSDVAVKCGTLLLSRMWLLNLQEIFVTASWLHTLNLNGPLANPPNGNTIPNKVSYVKHYALDVAYITLPWDTETRRCFKRRLYRVQYVTANAERWTQEMRVTQKHQATPCPRVWTTLYEACVSERIHSLWYTVIHGIVSTKESLATIDTERCNQCGKTDTLQHRITDCGEKALVWNWTRNRIAVQLRMDPRLIPDDWTIRPKFSLLASPEASSNRMDDSTSGGVTDAKAETTNTQWLHRHSATPQVESLPKKHPRYTRWGTT